MDGLFPNSPKPVVSPMVAAKRLRIAIADDEQDMRDYLRWALIRMGHEVVAVAQNGQELVTCCAQSKPDLIITDVKMPELDGLSAAREIFNQRQVPIILISAHQEPDLLSEGQSCGVVALLNKPVKQADIQKVLLPFDGK